MKRPAQRSLHVLPTLAERQGALETCAFCPKLCRGVCPVSNAEPKESLLPWGKMSTAYAIGLGDLPRSVEAATGAWACTGCLACRGACDHENPVADTLLDARSALRDVAPSAARRARDGYAAMEREAATLARGLAAGRGDDLLLLSCLSLRKAPDLARASLSVAQRTRATAKGDVSVHEGCCGYPLLLAGDREGFLAAATALAAIAATRRLVVSDPGCHYALTALSSLTWPTPPTLLLDDAHARLARFDAASVDLGPFTYHDPCLLSRGLGRTAEPRALLTHVVGHAPVDGHASGLRGTCSGGGGLLPLTRPATSHVMATARAAELPPGTVVTACASSRRALQKAGRRTLDLFEVLERAAGTR